jgi:hypothetical protein
MKRRTLLAFLFCAVGFAFCASPTTLYAAPLSAAASTLASAETSTLARVEYGCGWDYACPPRPWYGRRSHRSPQVYIENNYGTVNVYQHGRHHYRPPERRWSEKDAREYEEWRRASDCEGVSCGESCGIWCWYRRIRNGYCGHGCETYREQAHDEREYRRYEEYDYSQRYRYRYERRPYEGAPPVRFERPSDDERVPMRRFNGPKYP